MARDLKNKTTIPKRLPYGNGIYRRRIELRATQNQVSVEMVDDFHQFALTLRHDGTAVTHVEAEPIRIPWVTCPAAVDQLRLMEGAAIRASLGELYGYTAAREQCTHLHDLACLAAMHAARCAAGGSAERRYDAALPDRVAGRTRPSVKRDGTVVTEWQLEKYDIVEALPSDFAGHNLASGKLREAIFAHPDHDLGEAAFVLQRAIFIGTGRMHDFEAMPSAAAFASIVGAACHSFAPERADQALRVHDTVQDFTDEECALFAHELGK